MRTRFGFLDPGAIMGVVVSLIILGVGVFAFFVVIGEIQPTIPADRNYSNMTASDLDLLDKLNGTGDTGNSVFNILGIVLIIGAIMSIVGLVYNYVR